MFHNARTALDPIIYFSSNSSVCLIILLYHDRKAKLCKLRKQRCCDSGKVSRSI